MIMKTNRNEPPLAVAPKCTRAVFLFETLPAGIGYELTNKGGRAAKQGFVRSLAREEARRAEAAAPVHAARL